MSRKTVFLILLLIVVFHLLNNFIILTIDDTPPVGHYGLYFSHSLYLFEQFKNLSPGFITELFNVNSIYPPLLYLTPIPLYYIFSIDYDVASFSVGLLYLSVFIFSLYFLATYLFKPSVGIVAALIGSLFAAVFGYARLFLMAFPMVAILTLNIYLMFKTEVFKKRLYVVLFASVLALGMLMKKFYFIYISFFTLIYLIENRKLISKERFKVFLNIFIAAGIVISISGYWYLRNIEPILFQLKSDQPTIFYNEGYSFNFLIYLKYLIRYQLGWFLFSLFLISFIYLVIKKRSALFLSAWVIWPYLISSLFIVEKSSRYTMAMLPAIAIIIANGIMGFSDNLKLKRRPALRCSLMFLILAVPVFNFFKTSYGGGVEVFNYRDETDRFFYTGLLRSKKIGWDIEDLEKTLIQDGKNKIMIDGFGYWYLLNDYLNNFIENNNLSISFIHLEFDERDKDYRKLIEEGDFIILRSDDGSSIPNISLPFENENLEKIRSLLVIFNEYKEKFELINRVTIEGRFTERTLLIYKRI
ncbi:MAG: glycosyltransferase family 39 protein [Candidatus Kaelpia imicola]|nr:glycosyltransferase family 39 protein [Candidatus Kaelpia imicola]